MIYLINLEGNSLYKIGRTTNVNKRIKQLQTAASFPLILVKEFNTGNEESKLESTIHRYFSYCKTSGEWFDFDMLETHKVIEIIYELQKNVILVST